MIAAAAKRVEYMIVNDWMGRNESELSAKWSQATERRKSLQVDTLLVSSNE